MKKAKKAKAANVEAEGKTGKKKGGKKKLLLIPVALVGLWFVLPDTITARFASIGNLGDASTSYRVYIWMGTLAMLKNYWLCGIGPGADAFNMVYPAYSYNGIIAPPLPQPVFCRLSATRGVAALGVFILLLFVFFRMMCAALHREKDWTAVCSR